MKMNVSVLSGQDHLLRAAIIWFAAQTYHILAPLGW